MKNRITLPMKIVLFSLVVVIIGYLFYTAFILPPTLARDPSISTLSNATAELDLSQFASGNGQLTYKIVRDPQSGSASLFGSLASYTPEACYEGRDSFSYEVRDIPLLPWRKATGNVVVTVDNPEVTYRVTVEINVDQFKPCDDACLSSREQCDWDTGPLCIPLPDPVHKPDILANLHFAGRKLTVPEYENDYVVRHIFHDVALKLCDAIDIEVLDVDNNGADEIGSWEDIFEEKTLSIEVGHAEVTLTFVPEL